MSDTTTLDNASDSINEIFAALAKAQGELGSVAKDAKNPHLKNTYSTLHALVEAIRGPLTSNGICWTHQSTVLDGVQYVRTTLGHTSGQWLSSLVPVELGRGGGPQAMGSGITYARRYGLASLAGVASADEDDDGERAQRATSQRRREPGPHERAPQPAPKPAPSEAYTEMWKAIAAARTLAELGAIQPTNDLTEDERKRAIEAWRKRKQEVTAEEPGSFGWDE